ncbi:hypothetical protein [Actinomycetospora termitidis]|uniref:Uncharacterized protein n=1 Tax=Actinomycetospora termitidis TaxID=3053470 RepID=A0ABT7MGS9_9PSEU|nr:hypothetical protein [Actinomycetospora sp. Odt1-22]MDL5159893.1 hypothetical protein [Actinomycetospora sp. Odt1-22]
MAGAGMTTRGFSAAVVLATAVALDLVAQEPRGHVLAVALAASSVGAARLLLAHRWRGTFALLNLAVLAQPAAHAVTKLTPHAHGISPVALQIAVTLLVVLVAGGEPLLVVAATLPLVRLLLTVPPDGPPRTVRTAPPAVGNLSGVDLARCLPRRGPPSPA